MAKIKKGKKYLLVYEVECSTEEDEFTGAHCICTGTGKIDDIYLQRALESGANIYRLKE